MNKRQRLLGRLILLNLVLLGLSLVWYARGNGRIQIALAKSGANFYAYTLPGVALDQNWVRQITLADPQIHHPSPTRRPPVPRSAILAKKTQNTPILTWYGTTYLVLGSRLSGAPLR